MNNHSKTFLYVLLGILASALITALIALSSFSAVAYKNSMENKERIAVIESTQEIILDKINEIAQDVKQLLRSGGE